MKRVLVLLLLAMSAAFAKAQNGNPPVTCSWPIPGANIVVCCGPCACVVCAGFTDPTAPGSCIDIALQCTVPQTIQRPLVFTARLEMPKVEVPPVINR